MQNKKLPYKRYQIGPVFRDEPTNANRFRQFTQCDIDIINSSVKDDAEILKASSEILDKLNINSTIDFNNRELLNEILDEAKVSQKDKQQVIREIDKLDKQPEEEIKKELKKFGAEKVLELFKKPKSYFKKYKSFSQVEELEKYAGLYKIKVNFKPCLARGLSYYNKTVFEFKTQSMKETIAGGGSYLFNGIQCTGIALGLDRLAILSKIPVEKKQILIISINQDQKSIELAQQLRDSKVPASILYGKPSKALEYANSYNIPYVIFLGEEEVKSKKLKLKNMKTGEEKMISQKDIEKEII
jgi:histidyl-tRNA synthetase